MGDEKHIHKVARNIMGQFRIRPETYSTCSDAENIAQQIYASHSSTLRTGIYRLKWSPGMLGELAFEGRGQSSFHPGVRLYGVHKKDWLDQREGGGPMVREIALTALIAAMADLVWEDLQKMKAKPQASGNEDKIKCAFCEKTFPKFWKGKERSVRSGLLPLAAHIDEEHPEQAEIIEQYMSIQENLLRK